MKARLEFIIPEPTERIVFISEFIDISEEDLLVLSIASESGLMKSNEWITVDEERGFLILKNSYYPIDHLKFVKIRIVDELSDYFLDPR